MTLGPSPSPNGWPNPTHSMLLREKAMSGSLAGRYIRYHPGGCRRHGSLPYRQVSAHKVREVGSSVTSAS